MRLRQVFRGWVIALLVLWTAVLVYKVVFDTGGVMSYRSCATDPRCGEMAWFPWPWLVGCLLILGVGYVTRRRGT